MDSAGDQWSPALSVRGSKVKLCAGGDFRARGAAGDVLHDQLHAAAVGVGHEHARAGLAVAVDGIDRVRRIALGAAPAFNAAGVRVVLARGHWSILLIKYACDKEADACLAVRKRRRGGTLRA